MTLRELQAKLEGLKAEAKQMLDLAETQNRLFSESEEQRFSEIETELKATKDQITKVEQMEKRRLNMDAVSSVGVLDVQSQIEVGVDRAALDPTAGFASLAEFAQSVMRANPNTPNSATDERLMNMYAAPSNYHQETGSNEGYLVPAEYRNRIWSLVHDHEGLINDIDAETTSSNQVNDLTDETTPWGGTGIQAYWRKEGQPMTSTKTGVKPRSLALDELYAMVAATDELLEDAPRLNSRLTVKAGEAISWKLDDSITYGNGVGKPLGFMNSKALVTIAKETGQAAKTIVSENIAKMYARLLPGSQARSHWRANINILPQLMHLKIGDNLIWTPPSAGFKNAPGGFLLGRPIRFTQQAKTLGDKGDLMLVDPKGYYGLKKAGGTKFASSIHLWFDHGVQAFRWTIRFGGQPHLSKPVTPQHGTETLSHFVVLEARD